MKFCHPALFCGFVTFVCLAVASICIADDAQQSGKVLVYIGTYTGAKSKGIYGYHLDLATGELTPAGVAATTSPSYVAIDPSGRFLYAVNEVGTFNGKKSGSVSAFAITPGSGELTLLNQQSSEGEGPCDLAVDKARKHLVVANYNSGSIAALPIKGDGQLDPAVSIIQHQGSGPNRGRQAGPHAHSIGFDPAERFVLACDLGADKVFVYRFDEAKGTIAPNDPPAAEAATPGAGPRHFAFHPNGRFVFVNNEMASSVAVYAFDAEHGSLKLLDALSTLPSDFKGNNNTTAEIEVHPSGKFVYVSNRGHNSIAIFACDPETGKLTAVGHQSSGGRVPRGFGIDPTGNWLLAANQDSHNVVVFRIDQHDGTLKPTGTSIEVGSPVCVKMIRPAN